MINTQTGADIPEVFSSALATRSSRTASRCSTVSGAGGRAAVEVVVVVVFVVGAVDFGVGSACPKPAGVGGGGGGGAITDRATRRTRIRKIVLVIIW